jgi:glycerate dehydrogenase
MSFRPNCNGFQRHGKPCPYERENIMKIVILDALPLNPGDLRWDSLEEAGDLTIYERTSPADVESRIADAGIVLTNKVKLGAAHFEAAPSLKMIAEMATGFDNVDTVAAREKGIAVCNVPSYSASFTAQTTIALLLELAQHIGRHSEAVASGKWANSSDFSFWETPQIELGGKTLVIIGLGAIGGRVAAIGEALGMKVIAAQLPWRESSSDKARSPLDEALKRADVVSLHCPLKPETRGLVNAEFLNKFKKGAILLNTARGAIVDENAVADALRSGKLSGYAGDVLSSEPPSPDNPLLSAPNCLITPHLGWSSLESRRRCLDTSVQNVRAFLAGHPQNLVN